MDNEVEKVIDDLRKELKGIVYERLRIYGNVKNISLKLDVDYATEHYYVDTIKDNGEWRKAE